MKQNCPAGGIITTLQVLEALDRHCFDRVDSSNNIDTLHSKIFQSVGCNKNTSEPTTVEAVMQLAKKDEPLVRLLCQWAVSDQRYGEHRALATAQLLDKRQSDLVGLVENEISGNNDNNDSEEPPATAGGSTTILQPVYQVLFHVKNLCNNFLNKDFALGFPHEISRLRSSHASRFCIRA